jgi:hypothetical protein
VPVATAAKIEALRRDFKPAAALADLLGVSRSRVTRWLQGAGIDPLNAERVELRAGRAEELMRAIRAERADSFA